MDPTTGQLWIDDCSQPLVPCMSCADFLQHPLHDVMPELSGSAFNQHRHRLPEQVFAKTPFRGDAEWIDDCLNALWFVPLCERNAGFHDVAVICALESSAARSAAP